MDPFTLMAIGIGGSLIGRLLEPPRRNAPDVDRSLYDTSRFDSAFDQVMDDYQSQQVVMGEMQNDMKNAMNDYRNSINSIMSQKEALADQPSVVDAQMNAALDKSLAQQTALAGTIGGANAGLQQQQLMNQAASQQQGIAQQSGIGRLQEDMARKQMDMQYNQALLNQQGNLASMRSGQYFNQQQAGQNMLNMAGNFASQSAGIKQNYQNARNQQFQLNQSEDKRLSQANASMIKGASDTIGAVAPLMKEGG